MEIASNKDSLSTLIGSKTKRNFTVKSRALPVELKFLFGQMLQFIAIVFILIQYGICEDGTVVKTSAGFVQGEIDMQNNMRVFRGIPYAEPPIDQLRWQSPADKSPWEGFNLLDTNLT